MSMEWAELFDIKTFSGDNPQGFTGFEKIGDLGNVCANVPKEAGVYMILLPGEIEQPAFCVPGKGARANKIKPQSIEELENRWVPGTRIVYIGKAGGPK